ERDHVALAGRDERDGEGEHGDRRHDEAPQVTGGTVREGGRQPEADREEEQEVRGRERVGEMAAEEERIGSEERARMPDREPEEARALDPVAPGEHGRLLARDRPRAGLERDEHRERDDDDRRGAGYQQDAPDTRAG